jgi:8-oxo-dGTP pyrophosphatase MutT (NUDIX family)
MYWFVVRPKTQGVRAMVINSQNKVLLVKHRYGGGEWYLPGGGMKLNENCEDALKRELNEEVGITFSLVEKLLGMYANNREYKSDTITVYVIRQYDSMDKEHMEVEKKEFFDMQSLPMGVSPGTKRRIEEYLGVREIIREW